ncbi:MAG: hypothetical protein IJA77_02065 [Clostridia bacterium]|nr:hypothetical protein [Clostridia bacterium]
MRRFLFTLAQLTWGLPQTIVGFILYLYWLPRAKTRYLYHGAIVTEWTTGGGVSLGLFVFVSEKASRYMLDGRELTEAESRTGVRVHEYGHCIQSLMLGPLYLIAVGLPSYLWANLPPLRKLRREKGLSYYAVYPENWANRLGEWATKEKSCGMAMPVRRRAA